MEAPITRTCKLLAGSALAALGLIASTAEARLSASQSDPAWAYVQARTAAMNGDHQRSAQLLAALFESMPAQTEFGQKALGAALDSGQFDLALSLARQLPAAKLPTDARLLVAADELKRRRFDSALAWLVPNADGSDLSFLKPLAAAWAAADRNDLNGALQQIGAIPVNGPLAKFKAEETALLLLKFGRTADAEPYARRAIGAAGIREVRLRLALANGFLAAGDRERAAAMIDGIAPEAAPAARRLLAGRLSDWRIDTGAKALSEVLTAVAGELVRAQRGAPQLGIAQVARYANPDNSSASVLLSLLLDIRSREQAALAVLRTVPVTDPLISQARDSQVRILTEEKRLGELLPLALAAIRGSEATFADYNRLGDVYSTLKRYPDAADAYGRAIEMVRASGRTDGLWSLYLVRAGALEEANRWPEARQALEQGLALSPDQPLLLNFLGYARLERGEDLDSAEAMIRKASELAPDDASIIDSLGWAQFKRGKVGEAITTLQAAAEKDPTQAEIQEHLGDALYTSGRRYEARFAWSAALLGAEADDVSKRLQSKLASGLSAANAAP